MANTVLTAEIIAAEAIGILENNCVMGDLVYRGYEEEFNNKVNGYSVGDTISVRRPTDFTVRDGATASIQDAVEGKFSLAVDKQKGVDFKFTSSHLTLRIDKLSERIKPPGAVDVARKSYKGYSVRVIPYYDGVNDVSNWRLDVLYGVKTVDARLATRLSGT